MDSKLDQIPGLKIHKAVLSLARLVERDLIRVLDLSLPQFMLLMSIVHKNECNQAEIAKNRGLTEAAVSRMTEGMVKRKLIDRKVNPGNRRERLLELTVEGRKTLERAAGIAAETAEGVFSGLSAGERVTIDIIADKILRAVDSKSKTYA